MIPVTSKFGLTQMKENMRENILKDFYDNYYNEIFYSGRFKMMSLGMAKSHKQLEQGLARKAFPKVLEFGSGDLQHLKYVLHEFDSYHCCDINAPKKNIEIPDNVTISVGDIRTMDYLEDDFDRIIVTCVLHHLDDPLSYLHRLRQILKPGGQIDIFLSCDPAIMVRFLRRTIVQKAVRKTGYRDYKLFNSLDHRNHFVSVYKQINTVFSSDITKVTFMPLRIPFWNINTHALIRIVKS